MLTDFDKRDTAALKGLAIIAIVFHNFFHLVSPVRQNEFGFNPARFHRFIDAVGHPSLAIQATFSFFGHYGVQVFIFLSAYGLAMSHWDNSSGWATFMWSRIKKIYPSFLVVYLCWLLLVSTQIGFEKAFLNSIVPLTYMLTGLSNILPGHHMLPVGPWWFIPFIIQFYAIWPILRKMTVNFGWQSLFVVAAASFIVTFAANSAFATWGGNLLETPIGRMPTLCLGIAAARYPMRIRADLAIGTFAVLILGSLYKEIWPFTFIAALILSLYLYCQFREGLRCSHFLQVFGQYSLLLFLWNGVVRVPFISVAKTPLTQLVFGCVSAAFTLGISIVTKEVVLLIAELRKRARLTGPMWYPAALSTAIGSQHNWRRFVPRGVVYGSESGHLVLVPPAKTQDGS